jgi:hypothetical protein
LLYEFKTSLTTEVARYRTAIVNLEQYTDLREQLADISTPNFRNIDQEELLDRKIRVSQLQIRESLIKVRQIENNIRIIDPGFRSAINNNIILARVGRG